MDWKRAVAKITLIARPWRNSSTASNGFPQNYSYQGHNNRMKPRILSRQFCNSREIVLTLYCITQKITIYAVSIFQNKSTLLWPV